MQNIIPVPVLSPSGWVTDLSNKADALMAHFFESNKSQTQIYGKNITSLQWLVEQYGHDVTQLSLQLRSALENYLSRYYISSVVNINNDNTATNLSGSVTISIHAIVNENGTQYSIGYLLGISNLKITKIMKINNNV